MTMEDFWMPVIQDEYSTVRQPAIEVNNFELKLVLITQWYNNISLLGIPVKIQMNTWEDL